MKKLYEKPEVEIVSFVSTDSVMGGLGNTDGPSGMGGDSEIWQ